MKNSLLETAREKTGMTHSEYWNEKFCLGFYIQETAFQKKRQNKAIFKHTQITTSEVP